MLQLLYALFFSTIFSGTFIYGAEFPQCDNEAIESFVSVANNCSKFIYCNGVESTVLECDKDSPYFSTGDQKCHNSTTVCGNRPFRLLNIPTTTALFVPTTTASVAITSSELPATSSVDTSTAATSTVATSTMATSTVATSIAATSTAELLTRNTTSNEPSSPTTLALNQAGTTASKSPIPTVFATSSTKTTATTQIPSVGVQCPVADDPNKPLFLPHPKFCSQYYLCYHGVATLMKCPNKLHFDAAHQTCNTPVGAKCQVNFLLPRENCQLHTVSFYPHPTNCNYYYVCEYGYLMVMQCPFNMHWDYKNRVCAMRSIAKCYSRNSIYSY